MHFTSSPYIPVSQKKNTYSLIMWLIEYETESSFPPYL